MALSPRANQLLEERATQLFEQRGGAVGLPTTTAPAGSALAALQQRRLRQQQFGGQVDTEFSDLPGNILPSAGRFLKDTAVAVLNVFNPDPEKNTAAILGKTALGFGAKLVPGEQEIEQNADQVIDFFKQRYGSMEAAKETLINDPVGFVGDVALAFTGTGAGLRGAGAVTKASTLSRAGQVLTKAGIATDPLVVVTKAVTKPVKALTGGTRQLLTGIEDDVAARWFETARNNPEKTTTAVNRVMEGAGDPFANLTQDIAEAVNLILDDAQKSFAKGIDIAKEAYSTEKVLAGEGGEVLVSLNPTGGVFVDYNPEKIMKMKLGENITTLDKTSNKPPETLITVYRGAPKIQKKIVPGDFITTNRQLAKDYAGTGHVLEKKVPMKDILDDLDEPLLEEYLYRPKDAAGGVKTFSLIDKLDDLDDAFKENRLNLRINQAANKYGQIQIEVAPTTRTSPFIDGGKLGKDLVELNALVKKMQYPNLTVDELIDFQKSAKNFFDEAITRDNKKLLKVASVVFEKAREYINEKLPEIKEANQKYTKYHEIMKDFGSKIVDGAGDIKQGAETYLANLTRANKKILRERIAEKKGVLGIDIIEDVQLIKDAQRMLQKVPNTVRNRTVDFIRGHLAEKASLLVGIGVGGLQGLAGFLLLNMISNPNNYRVLLEAVAGKLRQVPIDEAIKQIPLEEINQAKTLIRQGLTLIEKTKE